MCDLSSVRAFVLSVLAGALSACSAAHEVGDAGPPAADADPCLACASATLTWGQNGGFVCTVDTSSLAPCSAFSHSRVAAACDPIDRSCTNAVPVCESGTADTVTVGDVAAALAHPDVARAVAAAPVLYGVDSRPVDGTVFRVDVGSARIEVGSCATASCSDVPAGVRALETVLEALTAQELLRGECVTVFGEP